MRIAQPQRLVLSWISAPADTSREILCERLPQVRTMQWRRVSEVPLDFIRTQPPPGGAHAEHIYLFSPRSSPAWTCLVANRVDGWSSLAWIVGKETEGRVYGFTIADPTLPDPDNTMWVTEGGRDLRIVTARKDTRWEFFQQGMPLEFEDTDLYGARLAKHRLPPDVVVRYAEHVGANVLDDSFWNDGRGWEGWHTQPPRQRNSARRAESPAASTRGSARNTRSSNRAVSRTEDAGPSNDSTVNIDELFATDDLELAPNLGADHPGMETFERVLRELARSDRTELVCARSPEAGPVDAIYIATTASRDEVAGWVAALQPDEVVDGWMYGKPANAPEFPPGVAVYSIWWD